jgi:hypothetical protein
MEKDGPNHLRALKGMKKEIETSPDTEGRTDSGKN